MVTARFRGSVGNGAHANRILHDDKLLVLSNGELLRYSADGQLDTDFGSNGNNLCLLAAS